MNGQSQKLKDKAAKAPDDPGVYLMKDASGNIIYVGKALSLRKRISSYFQNIPKKTERDPKVGILIRHIQDFEYVITDSEIEALILESTLIKKHKPKYNVRLKDDKRYPYIAVTLSEFYPRIIITRKLIKNNDRYFGPYTDAGAARSIVSTINTIFKFRLCKKKLPLKSNERPCLNYQMEKCSGLCMGKTSRKEYMLIVNNAINFLEGKIQPVINELNNIMKKYSQDLKYEKAAQIRDIIFNMRKTVETQKVYSTVGTDKDYIAVQIQDNEAVIIIFEFRNGILLGRKISVFENIEFSDKAEILKSFIIDYYKDTHPPSRIICDTSVRENDLVEKYLTKNSSKKIHLSVAKTSEDRNIIKLIQKNLDVIAADRTATKISIDKMKGLLELKDALILKSLPEVMECFDISNTQGKNAVASMVRFKEGIPDKPNYRRYKIKAYDSPNDPAMIHEAVARRLQQVLNDEKDMPDLIVIDGGKTQLGRALEVKKALDANIAIISIAKRFEEIFTEHSNKPVILEKTSPGLKIIQNIRDEAHRFAIEYHKKLRSKDLIKSVMQDIPDIGEKKAKLLLKHIGSVDKIREASLKDLCNLPGIGKKTAQIIYEYFNKS
ncbi:MAG: excinuclease ABC subunit UvrC [Spirochaetes bacterium]|nr:excinuclease ABC subunit UvrC [Spirochaetota bacterium]